MKNRLRPAVAAVLLLVPGAAALAAPPALVPQAAAARASSTIHAIALNADDGLSPGSVLQIEVQASPGARSASVTLAGAGITVPLRETRPGHYRGSHTVRRTDRIDPTRELQARLVHADQAAVTRSFAYPAGFQALAAPEPPRVARAEPARLPHDRSAPSIQGLMPPNGERLGGHGRVNIGVVLADEGTGIDPASVRLRVGGRDVTGEARITEGEVRFRDHLPPGRHRVEVVAGDYAGNTTTKSWAFDVVGGGERERRGDQMGGPPHTMR
jgi:hypothetical protein